jgi:hypothetical protein
MLGLSFLACLQGMACLQTYVLCALAACAVLVQTHTAQNWADTFISELNDTHVEADLRMRHAPPPVSARWLMPCMWAGTQGTGAEACPLKNKKFHGGFAHKGRMKRGTIAVLWLGAVHTCMHNGVLQHSDVQAVYLQQDDRLLQVHSIFPVQLCAGSVF